MTHDFENITYKVEENIAFLIFDRPEKLNAFSEGMIVGLERALDAADADDDVHAVIVTGAGHVFSAGADLSGGGSAFDGRDRPRSVNAIPQDPVAAARRIIRSYYSLKPVIAAVNGPAMGMAATLTLPMDIRIASTTARFGFVFTRRGLVPEAGSTWFLPRLVGISTAVEWCATGRTVSAEEAHARGLVRALHEPDDLMPAAIALAREIADNTAPVSVALARRMMWRMLSADPWEALEIERLAMHSRGSSADVREGVAAFLERRRPEFLQRVSSDMPEFFAGWNEPRPVA